MADSTSTAHLYVSVTQLAYTESQMSIHPRPPFAIGDRHGLVKQATEVANCAAQFRLKSAAPIDQQALFAAQALVISAQTMFDVINNHVSNNLSEEDVTDAVARAIQGINSL